MVTTNKDHPNRLDVIFTESDARTDMWAGYIAHRYTAQVKCILGSEVDAIMGVGKCRSVGVYGRYLWLYFFVDMECCGTREEKIKLKICACIGFGRRMNLVSACIAPMHCCTIAPLHQCTVAPLHSCTGAPLHSCTIAPLHHCTIGPLHHCTIGPLHSCTVAPLHCCTVE